MRTIDNSRILDILKLIDYGFLKNEQRLSVKLWLITSAKLDAQFHQKKNYATGITGAFSNIVLTFQINQKF